MEKKKSRNPALVSIAETCMREYGYGENKHNDDFCDEFKVMLLRAITLRYDPNTLHRVAVSGHSCKVRKMAAFILKTMGHQ